MPMDSTLRAACARLHVFPHTGRALVPEQVRVSMDGEGGEALVSSQEAGVSLPWSLAQG